MIEPVRGMVLDPEKTSGVQLGTGKTERVRQIGAGLVLLHKNLRFICGKGIKQSRWPGNVTLTKGHRIGDRRNLP